jgi:hypothetical protein
MRLARLSLVAANQQSLPRRQPSEALRQRKREKQPRPQSQTSRCFQEYGTAFSLWCWKSPLLLGVRSCLHRAVRLLKSPRSIGCNKCRIHVFPPISRQQRHGPPRKGKLCPAMYGLTDDLVHLQCNAGWHKTKHPEAGQILIIERLKSCGSTYILYCKSYSLHS